MTFRIPSAERRLSQTNSSQVQGNLYQTRNIDLDEEGIIKLAAPTVSIYDETDDADFDVLHSMFHGSQVYMVGGDLFREAIIDFNDAFTNVSATDTTPPTPGAENDGVYFNGTEVVSDGSTIKYNASGTWTTISGTPTGAVGDPTALEVFPNQNSLLVGRGNQVARVNTSWTVAVTLTLPADFVVQSIATNGNYAYIATRHEENGEAMMFIWTGINTTNDGSYGVGTYGIGSIRKYSSSVVIMDSLGRLLQFNGSGFTELAALPVYYTRANWGDPSNDYSGIRNRGMVVDGDLIYINIATETDDSATRYLPNQLGNIWCYDPKVGLYQRYSYTNTEVLDATCTTANINTATDVFTVSGATVPATGSLVWWDTSTTTVANLIDQRYYYVIKLTDTTMKLAETYRNALLGTAIDIGAVSGASSLNFVFISQRDFGQGVEIGYGASLVLNGDEYNSTELGRFALTGDVFTNQMATQRWRYMQTLPTARNLGYIVTPKMFADNPTDQFVSTTLKFKPLDYGDKITIKYRTADKLRFPVMPNSSSRSDSYISWTSSTAFTTVASPADNYYDLSTASIGDEVEIIGGGGSGFMAHIASISRSGFQYTVTLDTANPFYVASDTSMIKVDNWTTLETIDGTTFTDTQKTIAVDANGGWVQFKIIMEGVGVALYDTFITNRAFERAR
jgi:hypothetical protein